MAKEDLPNSDFVKKIYIVENRYTGSSDYYLSSDSSATPEFRRSWNAFLAESKRTHHRHRTWMGYSKPLPIGKVRADLERYDATLDHVRDSTKSLIFHSDAGYTAFILEWLTAAQSLL